MGRPTSDRIHWLRACESRRKRRASAVCCAGLVVAIITYGAIGAAVTAAQPHEPPIPDEASEVSRQSVMHEPLWVTLARLVNFAILAGTLVYFLRAPIARHMADRSTQIRGDLLKAEETRQAATAQLQELDRKMQALPGELEAMRVRGAQEIAAEEARILKAAAAERERLLEQMRREIELELRIAKRELVEHAASLAVEVASARLKQNITPDDQVRLVDRYLDQVKTRS